MFSLYVWKNVPIGFGELDNFISNLKLDRSKLSSGSKTQFSSIMQLGNLESTTIKDLFKIYGIKDFAKEPEKVAKLQTDLVNYANSASGNNAYVAGYLAGIFFHAQDAPYIEFKNKDAEDGFGAGSEASKNSDEWLKNNLSSGNVPKVKDILQTQQTKQNPFLKPEKQQEDRSQIGGYYNNYWNSITRFNQSVALPVTLVGEIYESPQVINSDYLATTFSSDPTIQKYLPKIRAKQVLYGNESEEYQRAFNIIWGNWADMSKSTIISSLQAGYTFEDFKKEKDVNKAIAMLQPESVLARGFAAGLFMFETAMTFMLQSQVDKLIKSAFSAGAIATLGITEDGTYKLQIGISRNREVFILNGNDSNVDYTAAGIRIIGDLTGKEGVGLNIRVTGGAVYLAFDKVDVQGESIDLPNILAVDLGAQIGYNIKDVIGFALFGDYQRSFLKDKTTGSIVSQGDMNIGGAVSYKINDLIRRSADLQFTFTGYTPVNTFSPTLLLGIDVKNVVVPGGYLSGGVNIGGSPKKNEAGVLPWYVGLNIKYDIK